MRLSIFAGLSAAWLALPAAAAPILEVSPSTIADSPTQTVITITVNPNGTDLAGITLNFSALASGLQIDAINSLDAEIETSGPVLSSGDWLASFGGIFDINRSASFVVGTLTLEGFTSGTPLVLSGSLTDSFFNDLVIGPTSVAVVTPEPSSAALLGLGLAGLAALVRRRRK